MRKWEAIFPEAERKLAQKGGFGQRQPFGEKPTFIIVDVMKAAIGSQPKPISEAVAEYEISCGEIGWAALPHIQKLIQACRAKKVPVIFITIDAIARQFCWGATKSSAPSGKLDLEACEIPEALKPLPSELVIKKTRASAFFGTPLLSVLRYLKADCLLCAGATTSGCLRASVVDAFSYDFPCFVVEECTFDRFELSHLVNLWDMNAKYANVITLDEALGYVASLP